MTKRFEVGQQIIVNGLLPYHILHQLKDSNKIGVVVEVSSFRSYPITILINGNFFSVTSDSIRQINSCLCK